MFNYSKRILLSGLIAVIITIGLFIYSYIEKVNTSNYQFICLVGTVSETAPEKLSALLKNMGSTRPTKARYEQGMHALESLGYGTSGRSIFRYTSVDSKPYIIYGGIITALILLLQFYVRYPIKKINQIVDGLILDIEHAMTQYPVKLDTCETNILLLNRLMNQITALVNQLNQQIELLKMTQNDRNVFIENISHQIKTPLTCISLDLELLENVTDINRINVYTDSCYTQIDHIEALINRLLKIGKLESGKIHYEFLEHNLIDTVSVLCNNLDGQYPDKNVSLTYDSSSDYIISYDIVWLYEALENIIKNCYLYSYDDEGIEISLIRYESYIKIILCDHGIGIPTEDLPYIFDRFYRSKRNQNQEGFGIGLNLAKLVIEDHHGTIFALSDNRSTQFIIHLPIII